MCSRRLFSVLTSSFPSDPLQNGRELVCTAAVGALLRERLDTSHRTVRVWSAFCSSRESVMLCLTFRKQKMFGWNLISRLPAPVRSMPVKREACSLRHADGWAPVLARLPESARRTARHQGQWVRVVLMWRGALREERRGEWRKR